MRIDIDAAEQYLLANARLLDRHRAAVILHGGPVEPVLTALGAYRNPDGGFGHALEPDVRAPGSEPSATLHALRVLAEIGKLDDPVVSDAASWISSIAEDDGGVPFVMPSAMASPHAPFVSPGGGGSFLTYALVGVLMEGGCDVPWLGHATDWCWADLEGPEELHAYQLLCALAFLDSASDEERAIDAIEGLRSHLGRDGSVAVSGGTEHERLTPLTLSPRPDRRSRRLFTTEQIEGDLNRLESEQQNDGGWTFDWLAWSEGQAVESRGAETIRALTTLRWHGRLPPPERAASRAE